MRIINDMHGLENQKWLSDFRNQLLLELYVAYLEARRGGKRGTFDEHKFEVYEFENLVSLRDSLIDRTYRPSRGTAHIIYNPVIREIFAASFRDRIIHHWMYDIVYDWWDRRFIPNSYSCREGRGTWYGITDFARQLQAASDNYKYKTWVVKLDIQGYFMSLPRKKLYERAIWGLNRQFKGDYGDKYKLMKFLWAQTIFDDPCRGVKRKGWPDDWKNLPDSKSLFKQVPDVGIVIGNLTSQLLSNIYLDQLDRFVKFQLKWKYYGRYVDDFYGIFREEELPKVVRDVDAIERYLKSLGLTLHPHKRSIQLAENGTPFLGAVIYPGRIYPGRRLLKNSSEAFLETEWGIRDIESVVSYLGHMKGMSARKILRELFEGIGWKYNS
ncbi:RNA-directed DNA polymerase [Candidatus Saccharibacteria bacterium]|nr:RNA-directed DNA polymerase [Candidatus Saccharibacteria bacterium]